jgi:hypothetical protein
MVTHADRSPFSSQIASQSSPLLRCNASICLHIPVLYTSSPFNGSPTLARSYKDDSGANCGMTSLSRDSTVGENVKCLRTGDLANESYRSKGACESKNLVDVNQLCDWVVL